MKLVVAIIQDYDTDSFLRAVCGHGVGATRIASAGGFLRTGNTTIMMGVEDEQVPLVKHLLARHCCLREETIEPMTELWDEGGIGNISPTRLGGGVAFVARVTHFERVPRASAASRESARLAD